MSKKIIHTDDAPAAIGPYSQAVSANGILFCSGQIALNPATGELVQDSIEAETKQIMANIAAVLKADGKDFSNVVKASIFLKSMDDYAEVNRIYGSYFEVDPPAREAVAVRTLPKDVNVEISVTAC
ncbi:MAG: Rid family detoxifying hydrolase [Bacteroidia bacterium]